MEERVVRNNYEWRPSQPILFNFAQWFQRIKLKCENLTIDDKHDKMPQVESSHDLWPSEL